MTVPHEEKYTHISSSRYYGDFLVIPFRLKHTHVPFQYCEWQHVHLWLFSNSLITHGRPWEFQISQLDGTRDTYVGHSFDV